MSSKILLDYFFPISTIEPTPSASTSFLKQVLVVAKPKVAGVGVGVITACTTMSAVSALTDNTEAQQLFNAGMSKVYVLLADDLYLETYLEGHESDFYTLLISSDYAAADIIATQATGVVTITSYANLLTTTPDTITVGATVFTAQSGAVTAGDATFRAATSNDATAASLAAQINAHPVASLKVSAVAVAAVVTLTAVADGSGGNAVLLSYSDVGGASIGATISGVTSGHLIGGDGLYAGAFDGVIGVSSTDDDFLSDQAAIENRAAFHTTSSNKAKNMFYAFGKLLSNSLDWTNQQYITMPFADDADTLGEANGYFDDKINFVISDSEFGNRLALFCAGGKAIVSPYIKKNLSVDMQSSALTYISGNQPAYTKKQAALIQDELEKVIAGYVSREWIEAGTVSVTLEEDNFVASGDINISEPKAMWRIFGEMRQTL